MGRPELRSNEAVFADSSFFIAGLDPQDVYHGQTIAFEMSFRLIVTSELVLAETLNAFCGRRRSLRIKAGRLVESLLSKVAFHVVPSSRELFSSALQLFLDRADKLWSFTDCSSFQIMKDMGLSAALTADRHFAQAGLRALLLD